jgi:hypothetical protein
LLLFCMNPIKHEDLVQWHSKIELSTNLQISDLNSFLENLKLVLQNQTIKEHILQFKTTPKFLQLLTTKPWIMSWKTTVALVVECILCFITPTKKDSTEEGQKFENRAKNWGLETLLSLIQTDSRWSTLSEMMSFYEHSNRDIQKAIFQASVDCATKLLSQYRSEGVCDVEKVYEMSVRCLPLIHHAQGKRLIKLIENLVLMCDVHIFQKNNTRSESLCKEFISALLDEKRKLWDNISQEAKTKIMATYANVFQIILERVVRSYLECWWRDLENQLEDLSECLAKEMHCWITGIMMLEQLYVKTGNARVLGLMKRLCTKVLEKMEKRGNGFSQVIKLSLLLTMNSIFIIFVGKQ